MKKSSAFLFLLLSAITLSCTQKIANNNDRALADSLLKINVAAFNSGSGQKIADMYTDDCLNLSNGQGIWSKDSILAWANATVPAIRNFNAVLGPTTVTSDLVFMQKYWTLDYLAGSNTLPAKGLSILIWTKQQDGGWKITMEKSEYSFKTF